MAKVIWYKLKRVYAGAPEEKVLVYDQGDNVWFSKPLGQGGMRVKNPDLNNWEAMYTPIGTVDEIKVGDWVEVLPTDAFYDNSEKCPQEVIRINTPGLPYQLKFSNGSQNAYTQVKKVAIPSKTIRIVGYEPVVRSGKLEFGCQCFSLAEVQTLKRLITSTDIKGVIKIQGVDITTFMINTLESAIINYKR